MQAMLIQRQADRLNDQTHKILKLSSVEKSDHSSTLKKFQLKPFNLSLLIT